MSMIRRISALAGTLLVTTGLALAAGSATQAADGPRTPTITITANGMQLTSCQGDALLTLRLFTKGLSCQRALHLANQAASSDRLCPKGWKKDKHVVLDAPGDLKDPTAALCHRRAHGRTQAFTYHLPTG
jgi:hypothetical protein